MLEAAIFGGLPETDIPHPYQQRHPDLDALGVADNMYPRRVPQQPSPAVEAQRRIREEQVTSLFYYMISFGLCFLIFLKLSRWLQLFITGF